MNIEKLRFYDVLPEIDSSGKFFGVVKNGICSVTDLFVELDCVLAFPWYFGRSWNAVWDCLRDFHWRQESEIVLVHQDVPELARDDLATYVEILIDAVPDWEQDRTCALSVFFPSSAKAALLEL